MAHRTRVLIAGGVGFYCPGSPISVLASAELYDPGTGTFVRTGGMTKPRLGHSATLLADGRVLITGPSDYSMELYDPSTGTFAIVDNQGVASDGPHTTTLLANGKVLFIHLGGARLYDPATGAITSAGQMRDDQIEATATLLL